MSFDCGLRGMTKWQHNSLDNHQVILYFGMPMWVCIYVYVRVCVFVLINTTSIRALKWVECKIWQNWVGLCGLPLRSNWNQICRHEHHSEEGCCEPLLPSGCGGLERLSVLCINIAL